MMSRTQIYLTPEEQARLRALARRSGAKQSEIIRGALDAFLARPSAEGRARQLRRFRGMWAGRSLAQSAALRGELARRSAR
jgi:hypothetical protein